MRVIDLRSDTVTKPTPAMLAAMMTADVGDDVFESDPTVNALQAFAAKLLGKEAALFCPSGTMTNQIAIALQSGPLTEVITEAGSHVYNYEVGGISFNARASVKLLLGDRGRLNARQIEEAINPIDVHKARTSLVCLENTANRGGGACYQWHEIEKISKLCQSKQLKLHLDGARLFNASVKTNTPVQKFGEVFDTVSVCLSKGLGAPVGSLLLGDRQTIYQARRMRKVMGGGMRQAGFLAAAGLYALQHHVERLAEDHKLAQQVGELLKSLSYVDNILEPETNILIFQLRMDINPQKFIAYLEERKIKAVNFGGQAIRFVTHLDVSENDLNPLESALRAFT
jgi:threonine aldolase